jgi:hypothetical protein
MGVVNKSVVNRRLDLAKSLRAIGYRTAKFVIGDDAGW